MSSLNSREHYCPSQKYRLSKFVHDNWFWLSIIYIFVKDTTLETLNSCLSTLCLCVFIYSIFHIIITCVLLCKSWKTNRTQSVTYHGMLFGMINLPLHKCSWLISAETSHFFERCPRKKKPPNPNHHVLNV